MATDTTAHGADPLPRRLPAPAGLGTAPGTPELPGLPDARILLGILGVWYRQGVQAGFPDLTVDRL
ncbi:hypothetical protein MHW47_26805 [Streptomyces sp. OfavH-34-F]|uniref:hypothetical protein n=1 Tax=unclassified Streptomyces TaxID=2593676 RepID=UPI001EF174ED|nr:hypothetical protein [Streptomyces sp. OfavH-34-F]MCG7528038.1 hypothetical protein [Streptomyces sp. OfavH-34-F]